MLEELSVLLTGINLGLRFLLITIGFVFILKVWNFFNVWHVCTVTLAAYLVYFLSTLSGLNLWLSIAISVGLVMALGLLVARFLYYPLRGSSLSLMVMSMGLAFVTISGLEIAFGPSPVAYLSPISGSFMGSPLMEYIISAASLISLFLLWYFLNRTRKGEIVESFSDNQMLAALRGVSSKTVFVLTWMISLALAAVSGIMSGWVQTLLPTMGWRLIVIVFAITILGRTSLNGILLSSLVIGIAMSFGVYYFVPESYQFAIVFVILILVLVIRSKSQKISHFFKIKRGTG